MKNVLITAGPVYGVLDSNKLVGNRTRGIWATRFAKYLVEKGYRVTLLVADTTPVDIHVPFPDGNRLTVVKHNGYHDYAEKCIAMAATHDAAVMAAAVVNWIPANPITGKMPTKGFHEGDIIQVPFVLAPRVIDKMKWVNPSLTLIGCKMLVGADHEDLIEAAYEVLLRAKCNVVIANDLKSLRNKHLVYQDRTVVPYGDDFDSLFADLQAVIDDEHFRTIETPDRMEILLKIDPLALVQARLRFDAIVYKYRHRFNQRLRDADFVFGSVAVPIGQHGWLVSPREKGGQFTSADAVIVTGVDLEGRTVTVLKGEGKATLNAPLLIRVLANSGWPGVLHLHEQLPLTGGGDLSQTLPYGPPGTVRDVGRAAIIGRRAFNIQGHGFVALLDDDLEILSP